MPKINNITFNFPAILFGAIIAFMIKGNFYMRDLNKKHRIFFSAGYPLANLYSLSKCDVLLSVPSSFAGLAHFIGETLLFNLEKMSRKYKKKISKLGEL
jgi:hypothetical protein